MLHACLLFGLGESRPGWSFHLAGVGFGLTAAIVESKTTSFDVSPDVAILTRDLRVDYGDFTAVHGLNLSVPRGEVYGMVGPNGAGKTSTIRVLATLLEPTYGEVFVDGVDIAENRREAHQRIGYMPDLAPASTEMKVWEFLEMFATAYGFSRGAGRARWQDCLEQVKLTESKEALCGNLSRGMTQRLILAKTLIPSPSVLLLDEPASGMDPVSRIHLRTILRDLARDQGVTVLISSHILTELADMCSSVGIMNKGRLVYSGSTEEAASGLILEQREVELSWVEGDKADAFDFSLLHQHESVSSFSRQNGRAMFHFSGDDQALAELLKSIVDGGLPVLRWAPKKAGLEDVLMHMEMENGHDA